MSSNPFSMFTKPDDYVDLNRYEEQVDAIELSETDRQRVRDSIAYMRNLLGNDFLRKASAEGTALFSIFSNAAPAPDWNWPT
jgi:hypothetical protein